MEANSKEVIYYSLDSYKSNYSNNLKLFLDKFNEANEYDFVSREINDYKNYLLIIDYIDKNYGDIATSLKQNDETKKHYYPTPKEFQILSEEKRAFGFFSKIVDKINKSKLSTNDAIFKQKLNFNKIVSFLESKESELPINSISENDKLKVVYIDKIKAAEELAKTTLELSLKQDFFDIESKKVNDKTHKELLKIYYSNIISNYLNIRNLYKASNEQFHFLNNEAENQLTEDDRIDFIATVLCGYLVEGNQEDSNIDEVDLLEIFNQLKNIDELIYETKLAELKFNVIKKLAQKIEEDKINPKKDYPIINEACEINEELIEKIRLQYSTSKLLFGCDKDNIEIVPEIQTHDYLKNHFPIDDTILKYYYAPTRLFINDKDFEKMTKNGFIGNIDRTLKPYSIDIFGAFHFRNKFHTQLSFVLFDKKYFINNKEIKFLSDLVPYFIDYSDGFKNGFNDFEKNCITPFLNEYSDKSDFTFKIFEYVTKHIAFQHSWLNNGGSFHVNPRENNEKHITKAFEDGREQGYFYKAWSIILGNNKVYSNYFKEYYSKDTKFSETEIKETKTITKTKLRKFPAKYHALAYILELLAVNEKPPLDPDGCNFKKDEIIKIGRERCDDSGQNFYNFVKDHYALVSSKNIKYSVFRNSWKEIVLELTNYKEELEKYIKNNNL